MAININSGGNTTLTASRDITIQEVTNSKDSINSEQMEKIEGLLVTINEAVKKKDKSALQTAIDVLSKISSTVASSVTSRLISDGLIHLLK